MQPDQPENDSGLNIEILETSFKALTPQGPALIKRFYEVLFERYPGVKPLFAKTSMRRQEKHLWNSLKLVVSNLRKPDALLPALKSLGVKHQTYQAQPEHYGAVAETLLDVMADFAGDLWTPEVHNAWQEALNVVAKTMLDAYTTEGPEAQETTESHDPYPEPVEPLSTRQDTDPVQITSSTTKEDHMSNEGTNLDINMFRAAVDGAGVSIMMCDRDLKITYVNQATTEMIARNLDTFKREYPGFSLAKLVGTSIDTFHSNPQHQRRILSDPANLPYVTDIQVGSLTFQLNVTAIVGDDGRYVGNTLEWSDVTAARAKDDEAARLMSSIEGAAGAMMTCNRDLIITYANPSTVKMMQDNLQTFQQVFPGFNLSKLVGTCVDIFHKDPQHQRRILNNPANLPYLTDIKVGPLIFSLNVTAMQDAQGEYIGNTLEWANVTEIRDKDDEAARLQSSITGASTAIMTCDRDLIINYANPSTIQMVEENLAVFQKVFPGFSLNNLVGTCVDIFHKDPAHQRRLLNNPDNLPYMTDIRVGDLIFSLNVTAMQDAQGNYIGNTLEWANVTANRAKEDETARLQSSITGASTAIMTCDRDLIITYMNPATAKMVEENLPSFRKAFPGFDLNTLIGSCVDIFHKDPSHQRRVLANPDNLPYLTDIQISGLTFSLNVTAMQDAEGNYIGNTLEWANVSETRAKETEVSRLSSMIEEAATNFMVCNRDLEITYCNPSVVNLLSKYKTKLQSVFSNFDPERLIGTCIDDFHKNPTHQRRILGDVNSLPYKTEINVAGLEFGLNATALVDSDGNHIGNAVEWIDYNDRAVYSNEVNRVYTAIMEGSLSERGDMEIMSDAYKPMVKNINAIIEAIVEPIAEIQRRLGEVAVGDVKAFVTGDYKGDHATLKNALNNTLQSLNELANAAEEIARGNLTVHVQPKSDVDAMGKSIQMILSSLNQMLSEFKISVEQVATGSNEIALGSQSLAQGATQQASSLEQISASMSEINNQTALNAENATQANQLAMNARKSGATGDQQMQEMIKAMSAIANSSQEISKIIKVIDDIAFQTNLLALNAAVEAARAGVHGKGFAVVANEVRSLAARSANAAKETTEMIENSIRSVQDGTEIANGTAEALTEIVEVVGKVSDLVSEIEAASKEQSESIGQINQGLTQIEQVTQQNTANAEQSAAAAEELSGQAAHLKQQLTKFQLKEITTQAGLPDGITPEMLDAIKQYLTLQGGPALPQPQAAALPQAPQAPGAYPQAPQAPGAYPQAPGMGPQQPMGAPNIGPAATPPAPAGPRTGAPQGKQVGPNQIIKLDDDDFGRF